MFAAFNFFVAVKAGSNSDIKVARKRIQHMLEALSTPAAAKNVHVATVLEETWGPNVARREKVKAFMQKELAPIFSAYPEVNLQFHVIPLLRPTVYGSYTDVPLCKAELLCSEAAALQCSVMVIGGQSQAIRDSLPGSFLIGHSTRHWILKRSAVPVYLQAAEQLVLPGSAPNTKAKAPVRRLPFQPRMIMTSAVPAAA
ncbi:hypothetical protein WJX73_005716 [Symbiochloris irregularis]|uniref:Uncharacterized protein n=1 Tax=Symbiochloris irregularis TaxID=706552 RepID=A0AAW1PGM7_9CHLO